MTPGRSCPLHYRYAPADIARDVTHATGCLYVVGGLYGNLAALDVVLELAQNEARPATIVFNGDFNWFNVDRAGFEAINARVLTHIALRGNVETELAHDDDSAGCGCGYPEFVSDTEVERSNRVMSRLRDTARPFPALRKRLAALPMHARFEVGGARVAIVHGDCEGLAGWGLSSEALAKEQQRRNVTQWFADANVEVIASSHSCLPVLMEFATRDGIGAVINNGAAGMPNFADTHYGVITRIGLMPSPHQTLYGVQVNDVHIDALPVRYDQNRWLAGFLANWPPRSAAHTSYHHRIAHGPAYQIGEAVRLTSSHARNLRRAAGQPA
ncbi:MAG: hypothetical protein ABIS45_10020 [Burkholderiales bacterium]